MAAAIATAAEVLGDVAAVVTRGAASVLTARIVARHSEGLSELATAGGLLWLPRVTDAPGTTIRIRIAAEDVILSRDRAQGLSALSILPGQIIDTDWAKAPARW